MLILNLFKNKVMAKKYVLKSLSVQIEGRVFKKEEGVEFDIVKYPKEEIEAAIKAGFLVEVDR